jgi:hypothetical protein
MTHFQTDLIAKIKKTESEKREQLKDDDDNDIDL